MIQVKVIATGETAHARYARENGGTALVVRRDPEGPYTSDLQLGALTPISGDDPIELLAAGDYFANTADRTASPVLGQRLWDMAVQYWAAPCAPSNQRA